MARNDQPIIIKKIKRGGHAHHGGAWKIAYADFVTAMMAFFLLLWLISMATPEQKKGLADYFAPPSISESTSGAGGLMGGTAFDNAGAKLSGSPSDRNGEVLTAPKSDTKGLETATTGGWNGENGASFDKQKPSDIDLQSKQQADFHAAAASIKQAWQAMPDITSIEDNLIVEETKEGLNIVILDQEGRPMFPEGSKYPYELTRKAIAAIAPILARMPNQFKMSGHTAAGAAYPNPRYGAWDLSADRANVVRTLLGEFGLADDRFDSVEGRATAEPLFPNDPYLAGNGRVVITALYEAPPVPADLKP